MRPGPNAQMAALYAWRYSRAVYIIEPGLAGRLLTTLPAATIVRIRPGLRASRWAIRLLA